MASIVRVRRCRCLCRLPFGCVSTVTVCASVPVASAVTALDSTRLRLQGYVKEIECQVTDTGAPFYTAPDVGVSCSITSGLACNNKAQPDGHCTNYRIRYYCSCGGQQRGHLRVIQSLFSPLVMHLSRSSVLCPSSPAFNPNKTKQKHFKLILTSCPKMRHMYVNILIFY